MLDHRIAQCAAYKLYFFFVLVSTNHIVFWWGSGADPGGVVGGGTGGTRGGRGAHSEYRPMLQWVYITGATFDGLEGARAPQAPVPPRPPWIRARGYILYWFHPRMMNINWFINTVPTITKLWCTFSKDVHAVYGGPACCCVHSLIACYPNLVHREFLTLAHSVVENR